MGGYVKIVIKTGKVLSVFSRFTKVFNLFVDSFVLRSSNSINLLFVQLNSFNLQIRGGQRSKSIMEFPPRMCHSNQFSTISTDSIKIPTATRIIRSLQFLLIYFLYFLHYLIINLYENNKYFSHLIKQNCVVIYICFDYQGQSYAGKMNGISTDLHNLNKNSICFRFILRACI